MQLYIGPTGRVCDVLNIHLFRVFFYRDKSDQDLAIVDGVMGPH